MATKETALATLEPQIKGNGALVKHSADNRMDVLTLGKIVAESGDFADIKNYAQACVRILRGRELGIGDMQALADVYVIKGKTALNYSLIAALIKGSGKYDFKVITHTEEECELEFYESGKPVGRSHFDLEKAAEAGLTGNTMWKKYPKNMLIARAMSNGAKWYCSEVFGGSVYTPDELRDGPIYMTPVDEPCHAETKANVVEAQVVEPQRITKPTMEKIADINTTLVQKKYWDAKALIAEIQKKHPDVKDLGGLTEEQALVVFKWLAAKLRSVTAKEQDAAGAQDED